MGKPAGWSDEDCGTLTVRRVGATGDMLVEPAARVMRDDLPSGEVIYPCFMAEWTLTDEERSEMMVMLETGRPIAFRTLIVGNGLAPMSVWLRSEGEV
jgi:hypothetical protein